MEGYSLASVKFRNALSTLGCVLVLLNQIPPILYPYCLLIEISFFPPPPAQWPPPELDIIYVVAWWNVSPVPKGLFAFTS